MPVVPLLHLLTILLAGLVSLAWALAGWLATAWGGVGGVVGAGGGPGGGNGTSTAITASPGAIDAEAALWSGPFFGATLPRPVAAAGWAIDQLQVVAAASYDPLRIDPAFAPEALDLVIHDARRDRDIPVLIHLPATPARAPIVFFSHGLGGSREGGAYLARHWTARGYVAVFLQHPGSDAAVWETARPAQRRAALERAASAENLVARVRDAQAVLDQLETWAADESHPLAGRLDLARVGMSGHSFGALTTQMLCGERAGRRDVGLADPRFGAAVIMSPSAPRLGDPDRAFASVRVPWMLMTGTRDDAPIGDQTSASRREVFPHLPHTIERSELVLDGAEHAAFGDRALPGDRDARNPRYHRAILAITTAFWDAHLKGDPAAAAWLHGDRVRTVLAPEDQWQLERSSMLARPSARK